MRFTVTSVHTAKWIVDKCFSGDLIHGRTVVLVVRTALTDALLPLIPQ